MDQRWGDVLSDNSDDESNAIATSYRPNPAKPLLELGTKTPVTFKPLRENKAIGERRRWVKFGQAAKDNESTPSAAFRSTVISKEDFYIEDPTVAGTDDEVNFLLRTLKSRHTTRTRWCRETDARVDGQDKGSATGTVDMDSKSSLGAGKYIPPAARPGHSCERVGASGRDAEEDRKAIRVNNVSNATTEADLQDLFGGFGPISRIYVAKDKETLRSRGFAFVSFVNSSDAREAMHRLQGYGYDHLILRLEWARSAKEPLERSFCSGYGKALAQDTKEKVSYASNLTK